MSAHPWLAAASAWIWPRLVNHLWEGTLLALLVFLAALALKHAPARARHRLWLLLAVKLAVPSFVLAGALALLPGKQAAPPVEALGRWITVANTASSSSGHPEILCLASLLWAAGFACTAGMFVRRQVALARLLAMGRPLTQGPAHDALARLRRSRPLPPVRLLASHETAHLGTAGIFRPVILVPDALAQVLDPLELEAILEHELAHVRRRDPLVDGLQAVLACVLWFFPVVWLLGRRLAVERERACDEEVLRRGSSAQVYLLALLKACRTALGAPLPGMVTATAVLRERIAGLLHPGSPRSGGRAVCVTVLTACVTLSLAGMQGAPPAERFRWRPVAIEAAAEPVRLTAARARIVSAGHEEIVHPPEIHLENTGDRGVMGIELGFGNGHTWRDVVDLDVSLPPRGTAILEPDWRIWHNTQPAGTRAELRASIEGVRFEGGETSTPSPVPVGPSIPTRFVNLEGAPLVVTSARSWSVAGGQSQVEVALRNAGSRAITHVKLRFKSDAPGHAVTARAVELPPQGELLFLSNPIVPGSPAQMAVQVVGVAFEDGGHWGLLDSEIRGEWPSVELPEETR